MLRVTLRGLQGHVVRLLLTAAAVMLGVSFVSGTFVLRDSIDDALGGLLAGSSAGLDVAVRGSAVLSDGTSAASRPGVPLDMVETVQAVPGVTRVSPDLAGTAIIAGRDGTAVRNSGAPALGFAFAQDDPAFTLVDGRGPSAPGEVAVEELTLEKSGLALGDTTRAVIGGEAMTVRVTGEVVFGTLFGATAVLVDEDTARRVFAPDGTVASLTVTGDPGVTQATLRESVATVLPADEEAVTGATLQAEARDSIEEGLGFLTTFLLVFAAVALFVGSFIIVNTFSMLLAQRARELALLRALGASQAQVLRAVLGEAAIVGLVGSALGVGLGILVAQGAKSGIRALLGVDLGASLPVTSATVLVSIVVGVVVTLLAAWLPARRAARTAPVAAMRGDQPIPRRGLRRRGLLGTVSVVAGSALLGYSVTRSEVPWTPGAVGAVLVTLGVLVVAPWVAGPVVTVLTAPFVWVTGAVGRLARRNALRVPRRTAATASALMIGLALVAGISVLADSVEASVSTGVAEELSGDFVLNAGASAVPLSLAPAVRALPDVRSVLALTQVPVRIGDLDTVAAVVDGAAAVDVFDVEMVEGDLSDLNAGRVVVDRSTAREQGWRVGQELSAGLGTLTGRTLVVSGIVADSQALGTGVVLDRALYDEAVPAIQQADARVFVRAAPGTDLTDLRAELTSLAAPFLVVAVQDAAEFAAEQGAAVDTVVNLLYVLLLFSVVIAVLGIINTLALSVLERTREIGLLRAIGLLRRQLVSMITVEAVATAAFGAVLGVVLGLGLGVALQRGLRSQGLSALGVPWTLIALMLGASLVVGVVAAVAPSVRAARLDALRAITGG